MTLGVVILAAGQGTRMRSSLPKVLHTLAGKPLLGHVIDAARQLGPERVVVVYGHGGERVRAAFPESPDLLWVEQARQLGTGHAVQQAMPALNGVGRVLVLYGDVPLIEAETLSALVNASDSHLSLLTATIANPQGYGRIVRTPEGRIERIVEQKDATPEQLLIREINTGILVADYDRLAGWLGRIGSDNAQGEFYLTDIVGLAVGDGVEVNSAEPEDLFEVMGVNDRVQLAELERHHQRREAERLMREGVTLRDPARFDLRGTLECGRDVEIDCNVIFEGQVVLGDEVKIGPNCVLRNAVIGDRVQIFANSLIDRAQVGADSLIGPFARLRPGAELQSKVHIGNFVELKNAKVAAESKINHLSYVGDAEIGSRVNVGAGTITCNYDGADKHLTRIGDNAFIGSNTALVAPVTVGEGATIGAGSVIVRGTPAGELTLSRAKQFTMPGWKRPVKKLKE